MCGGGSSNASTLQAQQQQRWAVEQARKAEQRESERQANIARGLASIDEQFKGFDPAYYQGIESKYMDYARPQVEREYGNTKDKVRFGLARSGLLDSSAGAKEFSDLDVTFDAARTDVAARAEDLAENRRSQVEQNRQSVVGQLYASENPEIALQSSQRAVTALNQVPSFEPVTDILASAAQFASRDYVNNLYGYGNNGLFSPLFTNGGGGSSGSGRVIN
jgi:hypothetical protein